VRPLPRHYSWSFTTTLLAERAVAFEKLEPESAPRREMRFNEPFRVLISYLQRIAFVIRSKGLEAAEEA